MRRSFQSVPDLTSLSLSLQPRPQALFHQEPLLNDTICEEITDNEFIRPRIWSNIMTSDNYFSFDTTPSTLLTGQSPIGTQSFLQEPEDFNDFSGLNLGHEPSFYGEREECEFGICSINELRPTSLENLETRSNMSLLTLHAESETSSSVHITTKGTTKAKGQQNPKRNLPGLIVRRVANNVKKVLKPSEKKQQNQFNYLKKHLTSDSLGKGGVDAFLCYLKDFKKFKYTYSQIEAFLKIDVYYGEILMGLVEAFLSESGKEDFDAWVNGKKVNKSKETLNLYKDEFRSKFAALIQKVLAEASSN